MKEHVILCTVCCVCVYTSIMCVDLQIIFHAEREREIVGDYLIPSMIGRESRFGFLWPTT